MPAGFPRVSYQRYSDGVDRLRAELRQRGFVGEVITWTDKYPDASPHHKDVPFGFKPFCFSAAISRGFEQILWCDSSVSFVKNPNEIFSFIEERGYLLFENRHSVGSYCQDDALHALGISRSEAFKLRSCVGAVMGFDCRKAQSIAFIRRWQELASDGRTFMGPKWSGVRGWPVLASSDRRVMGHRHDQTAASVIAHNLGMTEWLSNAELRNWFVINRSRVRAYIEDASTGTTSMEVDTSQRNGQE